MEQLVEPSRLNDYLRREVWPDVSVRDLSLVGRGWESEIIGFTAVFPERQVELVLRMYTGQGGEQKAVAEGNTMRQLHAARYPVPLVHHQEPSSAPLGLPSVIMDRIAGADLIEVVHASSTEESNALQGRFVDLLVDLHRIDPAPFDRADTTVDPHHYIRRTINDWRAIVVASGSTEASMLDWFDERVGGVTPLPPSVIHNDYHLGNVLCTDAGEMTVIDWTAGDVSDRRFDLAWTLMLAEMYGGPGAEAAILERYESHLRAPDLDFFVAAARLRRLFGLMVSLTSGPEALGMRADAREQIAAELELSKSLYATLIAITDVRWPAYERMVGDD